MEEAPPAEGIPPVATLPPIAKLPPVPIRPPVASLPPVADMPPVAEIPPVARTAPVAIPPLPPVLIPSPVASVPPVAPLPPAPTIPPEEAPPPALLLPPELVPPPPDQSPLPAEPPAEGDCTSSRGVRLQPIAPATRTKAHQNHRMRRDYHLQRCDSLLREETSRSEAEKRRSGSRALSALSALSCKVRESPGKTLRPSSRMRSARPLLTPLARGSLFEGEK